MSRVLVMLPESAPLARPLFEHVFEREASRAEGAAAAAQVAVGGGGGLGIGAFSGSGGGIDLLILKKQKETLYPIIEDFGFSKVFIIDEEYYGALTGGATRAFLLEKAATPYERVYFPFNTFRANAYLFGALIADEAVAVNASLLGVRPGAPVEAAFSIGGAEEPPMAEVPWAGHMDEIRAVLASVRETLGRLACSGELEISGERPSLGILQGFGHDLEIFMKYAYAMEKARGKRVLDIGGGLGYGALLLSRTAEEVVFLDKSAGAVDFVKKAWTPIAPNLTPLRGEAVDLASEEGTFDAVFLMDVIEHLADPERLLFEARRLLRPGGVLVLSTPEEDCYPYRVCPPERWSEPPERLLEDAVWPWHIQALGEARMLPMLRAAGFRVEEKKYMTYVRAFELAARLSAVRRGRASALLDAARRITDWDVSDFALTDVRDPCFSAASYNITARKEDA